MKFHIVKNGESLKDILFMYSITEDEFRELNRHIKSWKDLIPGIKVKIPVIPESVDNDILDMEPFIEDYYPKNDSYEEEEYEEESKIEDNDIYENKVEEKKEVVKEQKEITDKEKEKSYSSNELNNNTSYNNNDYYAYYYYYFHPYYGYILVPYIINDKRHRFYK